MGALIYLTRAIALMLVEAAGSKASPALFWPDSWRRFGSAVVCAATGGGAMAAPVAAVAVGYCRELMTELTIGAVTSSEQILWSANAI